MQKILTVSIDTLQIQRPVNTPFAIQEVENPWHGTVLIVTKVTTITCTKVLSLPQAFAAKSN